MEIEPPAPKSPLQVLPRAHYTGWAVRVPWLAAVFFVGGAGRAFSWLGGWRAPSSCCS
jgi:hypothetical protein